MVAVVTGKNWEKKHNFDAVTLKNPSNSCIFQKKLYLCTSFQNGSLLSPIGANSCQISSTNINRRPMEDQSCTNHPSPRLLFFLAQPSPFLRSFFARLPLDLRSTFAQTRHTTIVNFWYLPNCQSCCLWHTFRILVKGSE